MFETLDWHMMCEHVKITLNFSINFNLRIHKSEYFLFVRCECLRLHISSVFVLVLISRTCERFNLQSKETLWHLRIWIPTIPVTKLSTSKIQVYYPHWRWSVHKCAGMLCCHSENANSLRPWLSKIPWEHWNKRPCSSNLVVLQFFKLLHSR